MLAKINRILSYLITAMLASLLTLAAVHYLSPGAGVSKLDQLEALILTRFIGTSDATAMEDAAADAMIRSLGDRWSYYIPASSFAAYEEQTLNAYVGIGVTIVQEEDPTGIRIVEVQPGGSAAEAGIQPDDRITAVNGESVLGMTTTETRNLVRGKEGTEVVITILRDGIETDYTLQRRQIQTTVASGTMITEEVGLVTIANFDTRCAQETLDAIEQLLQSGAKALIFDVRNNSGGYANELVKILDYLLPEGDLFRSVDYLGTERVDTSDEAHLDIPMAVLCNESSYSAAEFFAAAMQEYGAAVVVGTETCGKGYFQYTLRLNDGSAVALSVGKYFTPNGNSLIDVGIQPDIPVPVDKETASAIRYHRLAPLEDPQIQAALEQLHP